MDDGAVIEDMLDVTYCCTSIADVKEIVLDRNECLK